MNRILNQKWFKPVFICLIIDTLIVIVCLMLVLIQGLTIFWDGIAVDKNDNIYIASNAKVQIIHDGKLSKTLLTTPNGGVRFSFRDGENTVSVSDDIYILDADLNVLDKESHAPIEKLEKLQEMTKTYSSQGDSYEINNVFGRLEIVRNESEILYSLPLFNYIVKVLLFLGLISVFVNVSIIVYNYRKDLD